MYLACILMCPVQDTFVSVTVRKMKVCFPDRVVGWEVSFPLLPTCIALLDASWTPPY